MTQKRFQRDDWLDFGLQRLSDDGPDALKLSAFCKAAGRTIGSFYHHFKDQSAFVEALMQHWVTTNTAQVIAQVQAAKTADAKAEKLNIIAGSMDQAVEVGIRNFASQNTKVAAVVAGVDKERIAYLAELYRKRFDLTADAAQTVAELEYAAFVGTQMIWRGGSLEHGKTLSDLFQQMLDGHFTNPKAGR